MTWGLQVDGFNFTYGTYSVIEKGTLSNTTTIYKSNHPDIRLWKVFFVPVGVRDIQKSETRPTFSETGSTITLNPVYSSGVGYLYFILGR